MTTAADTRRATRRRVLIASGMVLAGAFSSSTSWAAGRDPRLLVIVLRGGLDGLAAVAPVGDPDWKNLRGAHAALTEGPARGLPLDGFFALNPAMPNFHRLYRSGQAAIVHAVASPYRERSHFDGQDVLESGFAKPGVIDSGWLNRALAALASGGEPAGTREPQGLAIGPITPLMMRGSVPVLSWVPPRLPPVSDATTLRLLDLYRRTDPAFARVLEGRLRLAAMVQTDDRARSPDGKAPAGYAQMRVHVVDAAGAAAGFLARPDGPRVGVLGFDGWDTHVNEGAVDGRLAALLDALDGALGALESGMGDAWRETVVAVVTEFGRTVQINGGDGTDHGTAGVALLAGGALKGGRVIADWPGLRESDLLDRRDLRPTIDLRAMFKGLLRDHLRIAERILDEAVFPDSAAARPMSGLLT